MLPPYDNNMVCSPDKEKTLEIEEINVEEDIETKGVKEDATLKMYKRVTKRLIKRVVTCKSPFIPQCMKLFTKITHQERMVANVAFDDARDEKYVI